VLRAARYSVVPGGGRAWATAGRGVLFEAALLSTVSRSMFNVWPAGSSGHSRVKPTQFIGCRRSRPPSGCQRVLHCNAHLVELLQVWDVGGQKKLRGLWHHYYRDCKALLFIVDSADRARLEEVKEELWATMSSEELKEVPVLIYANKQDLPRAVSPGDLAAMLDLPKLPRSRPWHVQACQAVTGDGLYEGLDWLDKTLKARR